MPIQEYLHKRHCMIVFAEYPLAETRVQREAEALIRNGYDVDIICLRKPGEKAADIYNNVNIYRENYQFPGIFLKSDGVAQRFLDYIRFFLSATLRLNKLNSQKHYATIQVHNLPDFLVFSTFFCKRKGIPVILDLHDLMPEFFVGRFGDNSSLIAKIIRWQEHISCKFANHVITVSEHWRQALIDRGVPADKCSVVMNVADDNIFHPAEDKQIHSPEDKGFRLIYHGSMHQRYGLDLAIQAVALLREKIPGIHLSLVGQGEFLPDMRSMIDRLDLDKYVTIERKHLAEELPAIILSCNLGVVPYRTDVFTDGLLPTKLMEYAALGMPAVAARTTAIQAYFSDTITEFFKPGDAADLARCILMLYHNPLRLAELAHGSLKFREKYNWTRIGSEYVALVERIGRKQGLSGDYMVTQRPRDTTS